MAAKKDEKALSETELGFRGVEVDPTPNENYTVAGVLASKPTPETDRDAAKKASEAAAKLAEDPFA